VIAFPEEQQGARPHDRQPHDAIDFKSLRELYIQSTYKPKAKDEEAKA